MSQIVRIGPQDAKKPVSLNPGDTLEVALPEASISGTWKIGYDRGLLWDEEEENDQGRWVLGDGQQQTVRTFLALTQGSCVIHCEHVDLHNGHGKVINTLDFNVFIGVKPSAAKKRSATATASPTPSLRPAFQILKDDSENLRDLPADTDDRIRVLEQENRQLQERLWGLTTRVVELAEGYASIVKNNKAPRRRA